MGDHPAIIAGHVAGEVAPVAATILALIGGSLVGGGLSTLVAAGVCFAVATLAAYTAGERATFASVAGPTATSYVEAARGKVVIPAVIAGLGAVAMIVGFAPGLVLDALGIVMVGALTVPVRSHISDQIARRVETANGLGAVLGINPDKLIEEGGWAVGRRTESGSLLYLIPLTGFSTTSTMQPDSWPGRCPTGCSTRADRQARTVSISSR